jgi:hypothetical protein
MKRKSLANSKPSKKKHKGLSQEETKIIETGIGDYDKCARTYIDNVLKNLGSIKYKGQGAEKPNKTSKIYNQTTQKLINLEEFHKGHVFKNGLKVKNDYISNMFESVFSNGGKHLNTDVIKVGAIVRIWSIGSKQFNEEAHSTATIDYQNRRVSFGTSYDSGTSVLLNDKKVGYSHIINSPEEELVKKILYNAKSTNPVSNMVLVAMGYLTEKHIQDLKELLIKNSNRFSICEPKDDIFIQSSSDSSLFYPILSTQKTSTNLFYNRTKLFGVIKKNELILKDDIPNSAPKKSKKNMKSINCAEFMKLLFTGIVCINSSHKFVSLSQVVTAAGPPSLIPSVAYKCVADNNYTLSEPSMFDIKIGRSLLCNFYGLNQYISMIVYTTLYFATSATLILPLSYTSAFGGWTDFISNTFILSTVLAALTSIKLYTNIGGTASLKFSFGKKILTKEELISLFGKEDTNMFIKMAKNIDTSAGSTSTEDTSTTDTSTADTSTAGTMEDTSTAGTMEDTSTAGTMEDTSPEDTSPEDTGFLENKFSSFGFKRSSKKQSRRRLSKKQSRRRSSKKQSRRRSSKKQSRRRHY